MDGDSLVTRLPTHEHRLDNGLTLLVREDHSAPVTAVVTHVKAGYFDEPDRLVGISHVLEHMFFKGTRRRGVGEIARETKAAGGYLNAGTIYNYTSYYTVLPAESLELGLDVQSDALRNSVIEPDELRRELLVITQEVKRKRDNPGALAVESLYATLFEAHPMRRWRMGTEDQLRRYTRDHVLEFYRSMYGPSNIVLVVAGDVDPERTLRLVERFYGDMEPAPPPDRDRPEEPAPAAFRYREMAGDIAHSYIELGWTTPGTLHPDTPALDVLALILGQGRASRLYRGVREAGWVTGISAYNYTPDEVGVLGVGAELVPDDTEHALAAIGAELRRIREDAVTDEELQRAKNMIEARHMRRLETVEGQANLLADWQALGDWRLVETYYERVAATRSADLRRVAREYLDLDRAALFVYRPESAPPLDAGAGGAERLLRGATNGVAGPTGPADPGAEAPAAAPAIGRADTVAVEQRREEDGVHFFELESGVPVVVQPMTHSPLVSMTLACPGGPALEPRSRTGITGLVARTSIKGTRTRDARRIAEETEWLGGAISPSVSPDLLQWSLTVPARHFGAAFELLADVALDPVFPQEPLERERKVALANLERLRDDMYRYPLRLFLEGAFPDHPYGATIEAAEASIGGLDRESVVDWHRRRVHGARPWVLVAGNVDPDDVVRAASAALGTHAAEDGRPDATAPRWPSGPTRRAVQRDKAQTALFLGFPGPVRTDPERYTLHVLANAISGLGNRLFEELRSRRSLAYTVSAQPLTRVHGGAFLGYIATSPEREDEARQGLLEQFAQVADGGVTAEETERARRYAVGTWKIRRQTVAAQLMDLTSALLLGEGLREIRRYEARVRAITAEEIRAVMQRYFDPDRVVEGVVRGAE